jgi:hypothetical protein
VKSVNIGERAFLNSLSLVGGMVWSRNVFHPGSKEVAEFKDIVWEVLKLTGDSKFIRSLPSLGDV